MTQRTHSTVEPALGIGDALGHYRIVGVLRGLGSGRLYVAEQHGIRGVSRIVALRCIRTELVQGPHFRTLFLDAASLAPRYEHPNVVAIHEMGEVKGNYFVSMEYLPAENLASIITRCKTTAHVPHDIAASVVKQASTAVQYLHDLRAAATRPSGLGRGEIDPSNIFVTYHGAVKFLGVGLRPNLATEGSTASGVNVVGASQARANLEPNDDVADCHADIFRLGVVLWTCLTGQRPLPEGDEVNGAAQGGVLAAPSSVGADVPAALEAITMRALSPDPDERFQTAHALSTALEQYLLQRDTWPTPRYVRRWMEHLFNADRATAQMQIARGRDVEEALSLLANPPRPGSGTHALQTRMSLRPRELWSTSQSPLSRRSRESAPPPRSASLGPGSALSERLPLSSELPRQTLSSFTGAPTPANVGPAHEPAPSTRPRTWMIILVVTACALIAIATGLILSSSTSSPFQDASRGSQLSGLSGQVDVRSSPEGAAVFVDGEPTGLRTPATLRGLADGRKLLLRVERAGFSSQAREIPVVGGSVVTYTFELLASDGLVLFAGAPADARVYVDDVEVSIAKPVSLSVGPHDVRVETPSSLIFSGTVGVVAGEQTIRVDGARASP
jgi:eukaryotic-like serine/threonine-protein kinase